MTQKERRLRIKNPPLVIGISILAIILVSMSLVALFGNFTISIDIRHRLNPASGANWLGTDDLGRDLLSCIIYGTGVSVLTALAVILCTSAVGTIIGIFSALTGRLVDTVIMRIGDIVLAFPGILLVIAIAAFSSPGIPGLIFLLSITGWVEYARLARGEVLKYKNSDFILAARCYNASSWRILVHHMLPLVFPLIIVQASASITGVIIAESTVHFLGLGGNPAVPTLGQLIDSGRGFIYNHPILIIIPGLVLFLLVTAFQFIGDGANRFD